MCVPIFENLVLWVPVFEAHRRVIMSARLLGVEGVVEKSAEGVVHLIAERLYDRSGELNRLSSDHDTTVQLSGADEFVHPQHPRDLRMLPGSRDFH